MAQFVDDAAADVSEAKRASALCRYAFTINNPAEAPTWRPQDMKWLIYAMEKGEEDETLHWQGYVELFKRLRITQVKAWGGEWGRAHLEKARASSKKNFEYVTKDKVDGVGGMELGAFHEFGQRPDFAAQAGDFFKKVRTLQSIESVTDEEFPFYVRYKRTIDEIVKENNAKFARANIKLDVHPRNYAWQSALFDLLDDDPDPRRVLWRWEPSGRCGKTTFARYALKKWDTAVFTTTTYDRVFRAYKGERVVVFDICRDEMEKKGFSYSTLESLKNGFATSTMYEPETKIFDTPHVVVFANWPPDLCKLSADRWDVQLIDNTLDEGEEEP